MGIMSGRDIFSPKWITAEIDDANGRRWFIAIKHTIGGFFLARVDHQLYCFELDYRQVKTYVAKGARSLKMIHYDTTHFRPIDARSQQELKAWLEQHQMEAVGIKAHLFMRLLGKREAAGNKPPHDIPKLADLYQSDEPEVQEIISFMKGLGTDQIISPTGRLADFLDSELRTTRPAFLGQLAHHIQNTDRAHKELNNVPITATFGWLKMGLIIIMGLACVGVLWVGYEAGWIPTGELSPQEIIDQYGTPEAVRNAIVSGELSVEQLPEEIRTMLEANERLELIDGFNTPQLVPILPENIPQPQLDAPFLEADTLIQAPPLNETETQLEVLPDPIQEQPSLEAARDELIDLADSVLPDIIGFELDP